MQHYWHDWLPLEQEKQEKQETSRRCSVLCYLMLRGKPEELCVVWVHDPSILCVRRPCNKRREREEKQRNRLETPGNLGGASWSIKKASGKPSKGQVQRIASGCLWNTKSPFSIKSHTSKMKIKATSALMRAVNTKCLRSQPIILSNKSAQFLCILYFKFSSNGTSTRMKINDR